jgi:predicted nucleic acid-binding protein
MSEASRGLSAAITFWETLRDIRTPILTVEPVDIETAWQILQSFADQTFSFVDCTTFARAFHRLPY